MPTSRAELWCCACYLMVALPRTHGGVDQLGETAALHQDADVGRVTAEAAALPSPHQGQRCCHDNQLHPLRGAVQTPDTRGEQVLHFTSAHGHTGERNS